MATLQQHIRYVELKVEYWRAIATNDEQTAATIASEVQELVRTAVP
jgi:hypothetical protein